MPHKRPHRCYFGRVEVAAEVPFPFVSMSPVKNLGLDMLFDTAGDDRTFHSREATVGTVGLSIQKLTLCFDVSGKRKYAGFRLHHPTVLDTGLLVPSLAVVASLTTS